MEAYMNTSRLHMKSPAQWTSENNVIVYHDAVLLVDNKKKYKPLFHIKNSGARSFLVNI